MPWINPTNSQKFDTTNPTHHPTTHIILAVFETPTAAQKAVKASPLHIPLPSPPSNASTKTDDPLHPWRSSDQRYQESYPPDIRCAIEYSRHNHASAQKRNPYHSYFLLDDESYQYHDLRHSTGIPSKGFGDCIMARREGTGLTSRLRAEIEQENLTAGAMSLWGVYEKGLEGRVEGVRKEDENKVRGREGVDGGVD